MPERFDAVRTILREAVEAHAFPAVCIEVGRQDESLWSASAGAFTFDPYAPPATAETIFDLASLTKVIATTTLAMRALDAGRLSLDDLVAQWLPYWRGSDRASVTVRQLLTHSSGLTAYLPLYRDCTGRFEFETAICSLPLEYAPGTQSIYSDLGFILLAFILEDAARRARGRPEGTFDPLAGRDVRS
jgi:CubicO group peptidase (beta-lactamase class C family)